MNPILQTFVSNYSILFVGSDRKLWLMGKNYDRILGIGNKNEDDEFDAISSPFCMNYMLEPDDLVKSFYAKEGLLIILTNRGNLYTSSGNFDIEDYPRLCEELSTEENNEDNNEIPSTLSDYNSFQSVLNVIENIQQKIIKKSGLNYVRNNSNVFAFGEMLCSLTESSLTTSYEISKTNIKIINSSLPYYIKYMIQLEHKLIADGTISDVFFSSEQIQTDLIMDIQHKFQAIPPDDILSLCPNPIFGTYSQEKINMNICSNENIYRDKYVKLLKKGGLFILDTNVESISTIKDYIFYKEYNSSKIFCYSRASQYDFIAENNNEIKLIYSEGKISREIIFPFEHEHSSIFFGMNFVYVKNGLLHNIISINNISLITWQYFRTSFVILPENIFYSTQEEKIFIRFPNEEIYFVSKTTNSLERFCSSAVNFIISLQETNPVISIIRAINDFSSEYYFYSIYDKSKRKIRGIFPSIISTYYMTNQEEWAVLFSDKNYKTICSIKGILFFNIYGCEHYSFTELGLVYFDGKDLLLCTSNDNPTDCNFTFKEKICSFDLYKFDNFPPNPTEFFFAEEIILIKSNGKYFYRFLDFEMKSFMEIIFDQEAHSLKVQHKLIKYPSKLKEAEDLISLYISVDSSKLDKLLAISEMIDNRANIFINSTYDSEVISCGDGQRRQFFDLAMEEFQNRFLIKYNHLTEFNDEIMKYNQNELFYLGSMFHMIMTIKKIHLNIRLPLVLIKNILKKDFTIQDLEFFAQKEDPIAFSNLKKIQSTGSDSYEECLRSLCKYSGKIEFDVISKQIYKGFKFYSRVRKIKTMNFATLDYYLSGPYLIDRSKLSDQIIITQELSTKFSDLIINSIKEKLLSLPEEKLSQLLKNWTGSSVIERDQNLSIVIIESGQNFEGDFLFQTYSSALIICKNMISKTIKGSLFDLITPVLL